MAEFNTTIITKKGHALIAKLEAGRMKAAFTKVRTSDYDYSAYDVSQQENMTSIRDIKQEISPNDISTVNKYNVKISALLTNTDLTEGYWVRTIGLYAIDPDEGEILYSVTTAKTSDFIPPNNGVTSSGVYIDLITVVSNASNVSINVNPAATVTVEMFNNYKNEVNSQLNDMTYYVTLEQFGAVGDGIADDTEAFVKALATNKKIILQEKTYLIDFNEYDFTGISIEGTKNSKLMQRNSNVYFGKIGENTNINGFTIMATNNTEPTDVLILGGETHLSYTGHYIANINFICDRYTTPIHFLLHKGCIGGTIKDITINTCYSGITIESYNDETGHGWLTGQTIDNVFIKHPYNYGFIFKPMTSEKLPQLSHSTFSNISVEIFEPDTTGFKLGYGCYDIISPKVFNDNKTGDSYAIEFPDYLPKWSFTKSNILGGTLEGLIKNKQFSHCFNIQNVMLVERNNFNTAPLLSLGHTINEDVSLIGGDFATNTINNIEDLIKITRENLTITKGVDVNGKYIELSNIDDTNQGKLKFELGKDFFKNINYHDYFTFLLKVNSIDSTWFLYDTGISTLITDYIQQPYNNICGNKIYQLAYYCESEKDLETAIARNIQITLVANKNAKIKIYYLNILYGVYLPTNAEYR